MSFLIPIAAASPTTADGSESTSWTRRSPSSTVGNTSDIKGLAEDSLVDLVDSFDSLLSCLTGAQSIRVTLALDNQPPMGAGEAMAATMPALPQPDQRVVTTYGSLPVAGDSIPAAPTSMATTANAGEIPTESAVRTATEPVEAATTISPQPEIVSRAGAGRLPAESQAVPHSAALAEPSVTPADEEALVADAELEPEALDSESDEMQPAAGRVFGEAAARRSDAVRRPAETARADLVDTLNDLRSPIRTDRDTVTAVRAPRSMPAELEKSPASIQAHVEGLIEVSPASAESGHVLTGSPVSNQVIQALLAGERELPQSGQRSFEMLLDPPELGRLFIQMTRGAKGLEVRISAEDDRVGGILQSSAADLQQALQLSNLELGQFGTHSGNQSMDAFREHIEAGPSAAPDSTARASPRTPPIPISSRSAINVIV
jgi:flagellar hook-length control protein FliK